MREIGARVEEVLESHDWKSPGGRSSDADGRVRAGAGWNSAPIGALRGIAPSMLS
jgi:hypothetical protein